MTHYDDPVDERLRGALDRLARSTPVPDVDLAREQALLRAFDAAHARRPATHRRGYWWMATFATAASLLVAAAWTGGREARLRAPGSSAAVGGGTVPSRPIRPVVSEFILLPGAATMPSLESGTLVRMDVPVAVLPSLGVKPPVGRVTTVRVDLIVGQDGLARALRLVTD